MRGKLEAPDLRLVSLLRFPLQHHLLQAGPYSSALLLSKPPAPKAEGAFPDHCPAPPRLLPLGRQRAEGGEEGRWLKQRQSPWDQECLNKGLSRRDKVVADQESPKGKGKTGLPRRAGRVGLPGALVPAGRQTVVGKGGPELPTKCIRNLVGSRHLANIC